MKTASPTTLFLQRKMDETSRLLQERDVLLPTLDGLLSATRSLQDSNEYTELCRRCHPVVLTLPDHMATAQTMIEKWKNLTFLRQASELSRLRSHTPWFVVGPLRAAREEQALLQASRIHNVVEASVNYIKESIKGLEAVNWMIRNTFTVSQERIEHAQTVFRKYHYPKQEQVIQEQEHGREQVR